MYRFNYRDTFPCEPGEFVRRTMYDFDDYVKFAPSVTRVDVLSRTKLDDGREEIIIRVFAKSDAPAAIRAVFNFSDMDWKEHYTVDLARHTVDWKIETPMFTEYVDCRGTSECRAIPAGCNLVMSGTMKIRVMPMKGVPEPVVRTVIGLVEPFIGNLVTQNLKKYFKSVRECIEKEKALKR